MDRLRELLDLWENDETRAEMTPDELTELSTLLTARAEEIAGEIGDGRPTEAQLTELAEIDDTLNGEHGVAAAITEATEAAEADRGRASELLDRIRAQSDDDGGEDGDGDAGDAGDGEGDSGDAGAGDGGDGGSGDAGGESGDAGGESGEGAEPVAAAAPAPPPARPTRIGRVAARRPQSVQPRARQSTGFVLTAAANVQNAGIHAGQRLEDPEDIGAAFLHAWESTQGFSGPSAKVSVAFAGARRVEDVYPEDRILTADASSNHAKLRAVNSRDAIIAAGGRCVPSEIRYDLPALIGTEEQPVRDDMMVRFGAARGGVVTLEAPVLSDTSGAIGVWTEANDQNPSNPAVKPCLDFTCPDDAESIVDAVTKCLQFGNFRARFFGEQIQTLMDLTAVNFARTMEARRITAMETGSTTVTVGQLLGTTRDVLAGLRRATTQIRDHHRLPDSFPLRFGIPRWLIQNMQVDLARQMPVGTLAETLAVAEGEILGWLSANNVNVTVTLDDAGGATFGVQGDGAMQEWPTSVSTLLYPEGTWLDLDGGILDLGIYRDAGLIETNDFRIFSEQFQATHRHGPESWNIIFDICPNGFATALQDIDPCLIGS